MSSEGFTQTLEMPGNVQLVPGSEYLLQILDQDHNRDDRMATIPFICPEEVPDEISTSFNQNGVTGVIRFIR